MHVPPLTSLIGRAGEREAIAGALRDLPLRPGAIVAVEGEPRIGESRQLAHLADRASEECSTVLGARVGVRDRPPLRALDGGARPSPFRVR